MKFNRSVFQALTMIGQFGINNVYRFARQVYQRGSEESAYLNGGRKRKKKPDERKNHKNEP